MKKFNFQLQRLLEYRTGVEERLLAELAAIRAEQERENQKLRQLNAARDACRHSMKQKLTRGDGDEIREMSGYLNEMCERISDKELLLRKIEERRKLKMEELLEASRDRKALERLKERKRTEYKAEANRQEQNFLDEVAGTRHNRETSLVHP